jgi:hypothetical protein
MPREKGNSAKAGSDEQLTSELLLWWRKVLSKAVTYLSLMRVKTAAFRSTLPKPGASGFGILLAYSRLNP